MSSPLVIADASPLIALARIEQLELLQTLFEQIVITKTVQQEVLAGGDFADSKPIKQAIKGGWIRNRSRTRMAHSENLNYI